MTITVSSGVTSNGLNISSGDRLVVLSGGVVNFSTVLSGGSATLSAGALGENLTVSSGGALIGPGLLEGYTNVAGSVGGVTVADDGFLELASGGTATGVSVTAPAAEPYSYFAIDSGATASGTVVTDAFSEVYGSAAATRITGGGEEDVYDEGVVSGDVVESGGRLVLSGGLDTGATVERGGLLVLSGGKALDATVQAGGALGVDEDVTGDFDAGPVASATSISGVTVEVGGVLDLYGATVEQGATVSLASGTVGDDLFVSAGGVVQGAGALLGQTEVAGTISGVSIGGQLELGDGASASGVTVSVDASLQIDAGATVTGVSALSGALINNLGSASGVVVASKGEIYVNSGGAETGATVQNGGEALVYSGGVATGDTIQSGGLLVLQGGGASGETVQSGGVADFQQLLTSDIVAGRVTSTTVISGVTLESGAVVSLDSATVAGGVTATLPSGASASGLDVDSGAKVVGPGVLAGFTEDLGQISGATIGGPAGFGQLFVLSGGTLSGVTIAAGGEAYLDSGAVAGALTVSKGGVLFGPGDLAGLDRIAGEVSGITLAVGGAVELVSGGRASGVVLADQAVATKTEFEIDGGAIASGTEVGGNTREVVRLGGAASGATVEGGGSEYVLASGTTTGAQLNSGGEQIVSSRGVAWETTVLSGGVADILSGGVASGLALSSGGVAVVEGRARYAGAGTLAGILSGSGSIVESISGDLLLSGDGAAFHGQVAIEGGTVELAVSGAIGAGHVAFVEPSTGSAVLQIDAADAPAAGGTFANTISNFSGANEDIDLRSIAFVSGASATVSGSTLVLTDGGATYKFRLGGSIASAYPVLSDGHGGTLIDPGVVSFAQIAAAFAPPGAAKTALVSAAAPSETPFLHAAASATAGRL
jgi:fibronectin-binding autotransporter adhesin